MKLFITICLLVVSLNASAQSANKKQRYNESFPGHEQSIDHNRDYNDRSSKNQQKSRLQTTEKRYISKAEAVEIARQRTNGKILSVDLIQKEQQAFYKIKVLTDQGRIQTVQINAQPR